MLQILASTILIALSATSLSGAPDAPTTYIVGIPQTMTKGAAQEIINGCASLLKQAEVGSVVHVVDAIDGVLVITFTIPKGSTARRDHLLKKRFKLFGKAVTKAIQDDNKLADAVDYPKFFDYAAQQRAKSGETRAILLGRAGYHNHHDVGHVYGGHTYPSDQHLMVSSRGSIFGTADRRGTLDGLTVFQCILRQESHKTEAKTDIQRFTGLFLQLRGGQLAGWTPSVKDCITAALKDEVTVQTYKLREDDKVLKIHDVTSPKPPAPPTYVFCVIQDGSISSKDEVWASADILLRLSQAKHRFPLQMSVTIFRDHHRTHVFPLSDMEQSENRRAADRFLKSGTKLDVSIANFPKGSERGTQTGGKVKAPFYTPLGCQVDIAFGVEKAMKQLASLPESAVPVILLSGDAGTEEAGESGEPGDRAKADEVLWAFRDFVRAHPKTTIISLFTGTKDTSKRLFSDVASVAGERGTFITDISKVEPLLRTLLGTP